MKVVNFQRKLHSRFMLPSIERMRMEWNGGGGASFKTAAKI